ncbi:MAG: tetratricopeptide repeat protein [Candidatus Latescibacterota bacterium]
MRSDGLPRRTVAPRLCGTTARLLLGLALLATPSCVYFNTFYNARKYFGQAEKARLKEEREAEELGVAAPEGAPSKAGQLYDKAARKASRVLEKYPQSDRIDDAMFIMGRSFYWNGDYLTAEKSFADLESNFPQSKHLQQARYWRALSLEGQGRHEEARPLYRALVSEGDDEVAAEAGLRLGELASGGGDQVAAAQEYRSALEAHPRSRQRAELWLRLGDVLLDLGDTTRYAEADQAFARVLDAHPALPTEYRARLNAGRLRHARGDADGALRAYTRLLEDGRFRAFEGQTRILVGRHHQERGEPQRALQEYGRVRDDFPQSESSAAALYQTGLLYLRDFGQEERAREYLQDVGKEKPGSEAGRRAQAMLGYLQQAEEHRQRIRQADSLAAAQAASAPGGAAPSEAEAEGAVAAGGPVALGGAAEGSAAAGPGMLGASAAPDTAAAPATEVASAPRAAAEELESAVAAQVGPADEPAAYAGIPSPDGVPVTAQAGAGRALSPGVTPASGAGPADRPVDLLAEHLAIAELYRDSARVALPDSALRYYAECLRRFPGHEAAPRLLYSMAWVQREMRHDPQRARPLLERLVAEYPTSVHANAGRLLLGLPVQASAEERAAAEFRRVEEVRLRNPGDVDTYVPLLDRLARDYPGTEAAARASWVAAVACQDAVGDTVEAERRFALLREIYPSTRHGRLAAARDSMRANGLLEKLERGLKGIGTQSRPGERLEVIALEPDSLDSVSLARKHLGLGLRAHRRGALKPAREEYLLSLEQRNGQPDVLQRLGDVEWEEGHWQEAEERYRQALLVKPGALGVQYRMLRVLIAEGKLDSANHYLREIAQRDRTNPEVEFLLQEHPDLADRAQPGDLDRDALEGLTLEPPRDELRLSWQAELAEMPVVRTPVLPVYPPAALADSSVVVLDLLVDASGQVEKVRVFAGDEGLREAAAAAARQYRFYPAVRADGKGQRAWVELELPGRAAPDTSGSGAPQTAVPQAAAEPAGEAQENP